MRFTVLYEQDLHLYFTNRMQVLNDPQNNNPKNLQQFAKNETRRIGYKSNLVH